ncbi:Signal transduction histidine kinase [Clostridium cavendishii DSM 21758]|uniref:histidine kinase n=1 Tax=Clostridium cavendishii DSM 21758 TaxID=1121302 RepID=A0A1M6NRA3_9CLOT|nr:HAMP domain-containing sensor histidine kinase [Clostridium cavendishii]SHJ98224.1 Signal transduction histidine kinase [Clostridium cavendishii DSM 21758]
MKSFKQKVRKRKTLATTLLRNYILSFILMLFILVFSSIIAVLIAVVYFDILPNNNIYASDLMKDNYKDIDTTDIEKLKGFVLILDKDSNIIYKKGNFNIPIDKLTPKDYTSLMYNNEALVFLDKENEVHSALNYYDFDVSYNRNKDFLLVVAIPKNAVAYKPTKISVKQFLALAVAICICLYSIIFVLYAKVTSRYFIKPLSLLTEGAKKLALGNYETRIKIRANNEFGELSDAFNIMAKKIEEEKKLKEKSEEARKRLILDISHDLKNPLASIMGYSNYLCKNDDIDTEELSKYLNIIERNSIRANSLIQDLFEFSKLDSVDFELKKEKVDICEFLRELIGAYIPLLEEKDFDYDFNIPEENIFINIDTKHIDRALSNLLLNSLKYNPPKTKVFIGISILEDNTIELVLKDNGIGISKEKIETIFDPFVREDESRNSNSGGTGLGLAITKTIILKHNGNILLQSEKNKGCTFLITLPIN